MILIDADVLGRAAHRRRDVRLEPAARAAAAPRPTFASPPSRGTPSSCPPASSRSRCRRASQELRMAWSLPRLLRRLRPRARALPARAAARLARPRRSSRCTTSRSSATPTAMGRLDRLVVPDGRAARGAPGRPRARRLGAHEARRRRALRRAREQGDGDAERRRPALPPRRRAHDGVRPLRRRDPARARTRSPRSTRPARSACRSSSPGRRRTPELARDAARSGGADLRGYVSKDELADALPRRRRARPPVALRGLRAAGARGDGLRHAGRRRRRAGAARGGGRRGRLRRGRRLRRRGRSGRSPTATALSAAGIERAKLFSWDGDGAADGGRLPAGARRMKVSAIVVSHGHAAQLEQSLPALRAAGRRAAS